MTMSCGASGTEAARRGGGCAFCGAKMSLQPIVDAVHLIHGPMICLGHNWDSRPTGSSGTLLHRTNFTTDLSESDTVLGGERKLVRAIEAAVARHDPAAVFVYQTCVPAMIGDDVGAVCRAAAARMGRPVIPVDLPGLAGGKDHGTDSAGGILLDHVIGTREPDNRTATDINLIGEYNVAGELEQVKALLAQLGIRVLASIPGDGRYGDIAGAHRARASVTLCSRSLGSLAEALRDRYGIPVLRGSFYGCASIAETLRGIAGLLAERGGPADLPDRAEALIRREEARVQVALAPYRSRLTGKRALLATGGAKAWSLAALVQYLGLEVVATVVTKTSAVERSRAAALVGEDRLSDGLSLVGLRADVVLSGGIARLKAMRAGLAWVEVNHERRMALSGYDGVIRLAEAIDAALSNPLRQSLNAPPPWEEISTRILPFPRRAR